MRTLIDLAEPQVKALDDLARTEKRSRAALIREAVEDFLAKRAPSASLDDAFGLWGDRAVDGLDYQRRLRDEW